MSDTKILQAILDGQESIKNDLKRVENKLSAQIEENGKRIDKLGIQIASLEDDAPTIEEFDQLTTRMDKVEEKIVSI